MTVTREELIYRLETALASDERCVAQDVADGIRMENAIISSRAFLRRQLGFLLQDLRETPRVGGYFYDETGWWQVDEIDGHAVHLIGKDGAGRTIDVSRLPKLRYFEEAK